LYGFQEEMADCADRTFRSSVCVVFSLRAQPDTIKLIARLLLAVYPGTDSVELRWERSTSQDVEFYVVYYDASVGWLSVDTSFVP
jgi:hypothetical protein